MLNNGQKKRCEMDLKSKVKVRWSMKMSQVLPWFERFVFIIIRLVFFDDYFLRQMSNNRKRHQLYNKANRLKEEEITVYVMRLCF